MDDKPQCPVCSIHESSSRNNKERYTKLKFLVNHIKATLSEAIHLKVQLDPVRLSDYLEKKLNEFGE